MARKRASSSQTKQAVSAATTEQVLLTAILAEPEDDATRLVYADWLEEQQPERAEFIRLQIERTRRPYRDGTRLYPSERERTLLATHGAAWLAPLPERTRRCVTFERGFPGWIDCELPDFLQWDDSLWQVAPVTGMRLRDSGLSNPDARPLEQRQRDLPVLAQKPQLAHLRRLSLAESEFLTLADLGVMLTSPHLAQLRELNLSDNGFGDAVVELLGHTPNLPGLTSLNLEANQISDAGVALFAASPLLERLTELNLGNNNIGDDGAEHLAAAPQLRKLDRLFLHCNLIGDRGARALAASPQIGHLQELSMIVNNIGAAGQALLRERFGTRVQLEFGS